MTARPGGDGALAIGAGLLAGVLMAIGAQYAGPAALALLVVPPAVVVLLLRPDLALAVLVTGVVVLESDDETFLAGLANATAFYGGTPVAGLGVVDLLTGIVVAGVGLRAVRDRRLIRPEPFTLPLLLLAAALAFGLVQGASSGGAGVDMANTLRRMLPLLLLPFAVVNVVQTRAQLRRAIVLLCALVGYKVVTGLAAFALGAGRELDGTVLVYYSSLANLLLMGFLLVAVAGMIGRAGLARAAWWLVPLALAVLVLSYRRNFWIATVLGVVIVLLVGSGRRGRALLVPAGAVLACAVVAGFTAVSNSQSQSPVVQRAQSLSPSKLQTSSDDRYRLDEQRNVLAELRRHPLTGIGVGVPWTARYPLAEYFENGRYYTHVVALWYWLKLGLTGLVAYLLLVFTTVHTGMGLWRRAPRRWDRALGLGVAAAMLGLAVAETTGSFTGVDGRTTILVAATLGGLAAVRRIGEEEARSAVEALRSRAAA
jgi:hypothetical protein